MRSDTQTVTIDAAPKDVVAFVGQVENLPRWAIGFAKAVRRDADRWIVTTGQGEVAIAIEVDDTVGTVDFHVEPVPGVEAAAFARVIPNSDGAEFVFTSSNSPASTTRPSTSSSPHWATSSSPSRRYWRWSAPCSRRPAPRTGLCRTRRRHPGA